MYKQLRCVLYMEGFILRNATLKSVTLYNSSGIISHRPNIEGLYSVQILFYPTVAEYQSLIPAQETLQPL